MRSNRSSVPPSAVKARRLPERLARTRRPVPPGAPCLRHTFLYWTSCSGRLAGSGMDTHRKPVRAAPALPGNPGRLRDIPAPKAFPGLAAARAPLRPARTARFRRRRGFRRRPGRPAPRTRAPSPACRASRRVRTCGAGTWPRRFPGRTSAAPRGIAGPAAASVRCCAGSAWRSRSMAERPSRRRGGPCAARKAGSPSFPKGQQPFHGRSAAESGGRRGADRRRPVFCPAWAGQKTGPCTSEWKWRSNKPFVPLFLKACPAAAGFPDKTADQFYEYTRSPEFALTVLT